MHIPSFKWRKRLSVKERHYVLYGLLMREDAELIDGSIVASIPTSVSYGLDEVGSCNLIDEEGKKIIEILKKYSLKISINKFKDIVIDDYKERFLKKYSNHYKAPKYMTKRVHILGLFILFLGNIEYANGRFYVFLGDSLPKKSIINIICRLQDFEVLTTLYDDKYIVFDKNAVLKMIEYEDYYNILVFKDLLNKEIDCNTQPTFYLE